MKEQEIRFLLQQYNLLPRGQGKDAAALAEAALFLEETFPITLTDEEICEENLGSSAAMEVFVLKRLSGEEKCAESAD
jgi:hypothetical protein